MILVVGATGQLGGLIAQMLLDNGQQVRILVRPGSAYEQLVSAGAQPSTGEGAFQSAKRGSSESACRAASGCPVWSYGRNWVTAV